MARTRTPQQRIGDEVHAVADRISGSVAALVTMVSDPRAHRYQRYAARHARRALVRARRVGPRRAIDDRRVRTELLIARRLARASAHPHRHSTRNRIVAAGFVAAGVTGGVAYGAARSRGASPSADQT
jgi:hypothetical protein